LNGGNTALNDALTELVNSNINNVNLRGDCTGPAPNDRIVNLTTEPQLNHGLFRHHPIYLTHNGLEE